MSLRLFLILVYILPTLCACGIRGAPIPPSDPKLYNQSYDEYLSEKEKEDEQKDMFRGRHGTSNSLQKQ